MVLMMEIMMTPRPQSSSASKLFSFPDGFLKNLCLDHRLRRIAPCGKPAAALLRKLPPRAGRDGRF